MSRLHTTLGIIPARYASQRFPGKMLAPLRGTSLLHQTYANASKATSLEALMIATDDDRIAAHAAAFGARCVMTPASCPSGTDRIAHVIDALPAANRPAIVVNIQGDEPAIAPTLIDDLVATLLNDPTLPMATAASPLSDGREVSNPSVVKCVCKLNGEALYFSRCPIPGGHQPGQRHYTHYLRHIGLYAFRTDFLLTYAKLPLSPLQEAENLEQLKVLEHGYRMAVVLAPPQPVGVDTPGDLILLETLLKQRAAIA